MEWNEKAVRSYNAMFNNDYDPQTVVDWNLRPDILVHGSPCQDFSVAGKQYGGNIEDGTRSSLLFETVKIISNFGLWKPRIVVWENVPNVLTKKMRPAFDHYLEEMENLGYTNKYEILNSNEFGIPQNRNRIFVVSTLAKNTFDNDRLERKPLRPLEEFLEDNPADHYTITSPSMLKMIEGSQTFVPPSQTKFKGRIKVLEDEALTITTKQNRNPNSGVIKLAPNKYRLLTERECWRLMGFDDEDFNQALKAHPGRQNKLNGTLYHQAGNSIVVDVLEAIFKQLI